MGEPTQLLRSAKIGGIKYRIGDSVELRDPDGKHRAGDFLRIHQIQPAAYPGTFKLRGLYMRRQSKSDGFLDARVNELYMTLHVAPESQESEFKQGLVEVNSTQVVCKRDIILTNVQVAPESSSHPDLSFRGEERLPGEDKRMVQQNRRLVCRWASVICATPIQLRSNRAEYEAMRRLQEGELRSLKSQIPGNILECKDFLLYTQWRGDLDQGIGHHHTTVDSFCASGQVSEAFSEAGFEILCGLDTCPFAMETYEANRSRRTVCLNCDVFDFIKVARAYACDHLHTSFVCKTHSSLHTRPGRNDDANEATLFSTGPLVNETRPRIVTVENVAGLVTHNKNKKMFQKAVNFLTNLNYSVAWTIIDMRDYGLAARRSRLIMMASCPGTAPPTFPKATHGPAGSGLLPFNTIGNVLASIPASASHQGPKYWTPVDRPPYDDFRTINCITTGGGDPGVNYHPSGTRTLNVRELASLNGFRHDFVLPENRIKAVEMIGNAVPRTVFFQFAQDLKRYLVRQDEWLARAARDLH